MKKRAVVLVSGGLDSATTLAVAQQQGYECYALSFDYGQKHQSELQAAKRVCSAFNVKQHKTIQLDFNTFSGSALTDEDVSVPDYQGDGQIPITYVPARNTVFLSIALAWAEVLNAYDIFIGACEVDYSGYPDCRQEYMDAFTHMANLATKVGVEGHQIQIHTPLMRLTKAETIKLGTSLGVDYSTTITCYQANEQGEACGRCDACTLRKKGFIEAEIADPTRYATTLVTETESTI